MPADGDIHVWCRFGMMPFFNGELVITNVDLRTEDCLAKVIAGGVSDGEKYCCVRSKRRTFERNEVGRMPQGSIAKLWVGKKLEGELVKIGWNAIPNVRWHIGQLEGRNRGAVEDNEAPSATHHF